MEAEGTGSSRLTSTERLSTARVVRIRSDVTGAGECGAPAELNQQFFGYRDLGISEIKGLDVQVTVSQVLQEPVLPGVPSRRPRIGEQASCSRST